MCKGLMGKKLGMTGLFAPDGRVIPVTVIQAGPCVVTQVKTKATDGYDALQLGFGVVKPQARDQAAPGAFPQERRGLLPARAGVPPSTTRRTTRSGRR